ncbi:MAG: Na(+)-translocating NADH-quinone reductase subunit A [Chlamydiales bacterium]
MRIVIKKGLNLPLLGKPEGDLQPLPSPRQIALNLEPFEEIRFKVHVKVGDTVKIGQPLVESKAASGQMFASPAGGVVAEVRRGLKRRLLDIVIDLADQEEFHEHKGLNLSQASQEETIQYLLQSGVFPHMRMRPFDMVANPKYLPRDIFVRAIETLPFVPSAEMQVKGNEDFFQIGLTTLTKLTSGKVHLVYDEGSSSKAFTGAQGVEKHTIVGPHPAGTHSVHIHHISPIRSPKDYVWTTSALDVLIIGKMVASGRYFTDRIISIAGNGILEGKRGFFKGRMGYPIVELIANRISNQLLTLISGDPLTGVKSEAQDFLSFYHTAFSVIPENTKRQPFHFFRPGFNKYSATRTYFTGHIKPPKEGYPFTTNMHGEERAFIDGAIYDKIMPMRIPTMHLLKAIEAEDFEVAQQLGLLEVASEDFALATFISPSKIEMMEIVKQGLHTYSKEMGH